MLSQVVSTIVLAASVYQALATPLIKTRNECEKFKFELTWEARAPDGYERNIILVNGQSPGPTIHIKEGDCVEVSDMKHL